MNGSRYARAVIVALLLLICSISALDTMEDIGTPPPGPTMLGGEFGGGRGTVSDPYQISNVHELQNMSLDLDAHYVLVNDIDASSTVSWNTGAGFEPVGTVLDTFNGSLDGRNYTITALSIQRPGTDNVGLFGNVNRRGSMMTVGLVDVRVTGRNTVGGLVGHNDGTVSNCLASGNVTGRRNTGGLVGYNDNNGKMFSSRTTCDVAGDVRVGGLVGLNDYVVSDSHAAGSVIGNTSVGGLVGVSRQGRILSSSCTAGVVVGTGEGVGGLVGNNHLTTVEGSHATSDVVGTSGAVGGLVGWSYSSTVSDSFATGNVSGDDYLGGLVGWMDYRDRVSRSYATGNVSGIDSIAGGLVGYHHQSTVEDSYASGNVIRSSGTGTLFGGFVGFNDGDISRCYSTGKVTYEGDADPTDKGFGGGDSGTFEMTGNFWDNQTSLQTGTSGNATGKETMEMRTRSTFADAGWDFDSVWCILENRTYPLLRWQDAGPPTADAGLDQTVDEGTPVTFDGSGSHDDIGIVDHTWAFTDASPVTLHGVRPTYTFNNPGVFVVTLNVTDPVDRWATDILTVTVKDVTPPVVDAGSDQVVDEGTLVEFDGSCSADNVGIANYTWNFTDGATVRMYGARPTYEFDTPGVYIATLNVTDAAGNWATDTMTVTVRDISPPISDAGPDQTVDEGTLVEFDGSSSTDNVGPVNYTWTFTDGGLIRLYGARPGYEFATPGVYVTTLNVTDAAGNWAIDTVTITVRDVTPPLVVFGPPPQEAVKGSEILLTIEASDNVGVAGVYISYRYGDGATANETVEGEVTLSIPRHPGGDLRIRFTAVDAAGNWHTTPELTIALVNVAPALVDLTTWEVTEGVYAQLDLGPSIVDPNDDAFTITCDDDQVQVDGVVLRVRHNLAIPDRTVNLTISDGEDAVVAYLTIHVVNVNDAPVIASLEPATGSTFEYDTLITLSALAEDEDRDELTLTWRDGDRVLGVGASLDVRLAPGEHRIVLTVGDGTEEVEDSTVITVLERKDTPGPSILPGLLIIVIIIAIIALMIVWHSRWRKR